MSKTLFSLVGKIALDGVTQLNKDIRASEKSAKDFSKELGKLGAKASQVGVTLSKSLTAPIVGLTGAIGALSISTGKYADDLGTLSQTTGLTTDTLQELSHVAKMAGGSADGLFNSVQKLYGQLDNVAKGSGDVSVAFKQLGVQVLNADGSYRSMNDIFPEVLEGLRGVGNETERNTLAATIFGGKGKEVTAILGMTSAETIKLRNEAHSLGLVMSGDALQAADNFRISIDTLKSQFTVIGREIGTAFIPVLQNSLLPLIRDNIIPAFNNGVKVVAYLANGFNQLGKPIQTVVITITALTAALGPGLVIFGKLILIIKSTAVALGTFKVAVIAATTATAKLNIALLANPYTAAIAGVVALTAAIWQLVEAEKARARITKQYADMVDNLDDLRGAISKMRLELTDMEKALHETPENFNIHAYNSLVDSLANATVEYENLERAMKSQEKLSKREADSIRERVISIDLRADAVRDYYNTHLPKLKRAEEDNLRAEEAAEAKRKEWAATAKRRREELAALIASHKEALETMHLTELEMLARVSAAEIRRAINLGATYEQVKVIAERYGEERKRIEKSINDANEKTESDRIKSVAEMNEQWHKRLLEQSNERHQLLEIDRKKAIEAANLINADTANIEKYYAEERKKIWNDFANEQLDRLEKLATVEEEKREKRLSLEKSSSERLVAQRENEVEKLKRLMNEDLKTAHEVGAEKKDIYAYYLREIYNAEQKMAQETLNKFRQNFDMIKESAVSLVNAINSVFDASAKQEEQRISAEYRRRRENANNIVVTEEQRAALIAQINEEEAAKKKELAEETAKREKAVGILSATVNTASAIIKALADPGGWAGVALSVAAGITGAAQIAAISAAPVPTFYDGGLLKGSSDGQIIRAGERNQSELILPLERGVEMLASKLNDIQGGNTSSFTVNINAGTLIGDRASIKRFVREELQPVIDYETKRRGA